LEPVDVKGLGLHDYYKVKIQTVANILWVKYSMFTWNFAEMSDFEKCS
jgi:hypothetical protein